MLCYLEFIEVTKICTKDGLIPNSKYYPISVLQITFLYN